MECQCLCHKSPEYEEHTEPCCQVCIKCRKNIVTGWVKYHQERCHGKLEDLGTTDIALKSGETFEQMTKRKRDDIFRKE